MLSHLQLDHEVLTRVDALVAREHEGLIFRPTVDALVVSPEKQVLVVKSAKKKQQWGPLQGGIESGESAVMALFREVGEEAGISPSAVEECRFCYTTRAREPNCDDGRRKSYHFFLVRCHSIPPVTLQMAEVDDFKWIHPHEVGNFLEKRASPAKLMATLVAMRRAGLA